MAAAAGEFAGCGDYANAIRWPLLRSLARSRPLRVLRGLAPASGNVLQHLRWRMQQPGRRQRFARASGPLLLDGDVRARQTADFLLAFLCAPRSVDAAAACPVRRAEWQRPRAGDNNDRQEAIACSAER